MAAACTNVVSVVVSEESRNVRPRAAPICVVGAEQNTLYLRIVLNIVQIGNTVLITVVRVLLVPLPVLFLLKYILSPKACLVLPRRMGFFFWNRLLFQYSLNVILSVTHII